MVADPTKSIIHAGKPCIAKFKYYFNRAAKTPTVAGCILWPGDLSPNGYGEFRWWDAFTKKHRGFPVHKASLELDLGRPLHPGLYACHICPVEGPPDRRCFNPKHLIEDTQVNNMRDIAEPGWRTRDVGQGS